MSESDEAPEAGHNAHPARQSVYEFDESVSTSTAANEIADQWGSVQVVPDEPRYIWHALGVMDFRFGVASPDGSPGARYWKLSATSGRPELYVSGSRTGRFVHASFHQSSEHWHVRVDHDGDKTNIHEWRRPGELAPGLTRCVEIVSAPIVAKGEPNVRKGVEWYRPSGLDVMIRFDVFLEAPGARPDRWPGQTSMGTTLVGRVAMADGGNASVVVRETAEGLSTRFPDSARQNVFGRAVAMEDPWIFLVSESDADGHVVVLDMPIDRDKAAAIARGEEFEQPPHTAS